MEPEVFSPKKVSNKLKIFVIIELVCLIVILGFVFVSKKKIVTKTIDMSKPSKMVKIVRKGKSWPTDKSTEKAVKEPEKKPEKVKPETKEPKKKAAPEAPSPPPESRTAEKKEEPKKTAAKGKGYFLQLGAFAVMENFEEAKNKVEKAGYPVDKKTVRKKMLSYNVVIGKFSSRDSAVEAQKKVKSAGYSANISELDKESFELSISRIFSESDAGGIKEKLADSDIKSRIKKEEREYDLHILRAGPYDSEEEALGIKKELVEKGFPEPYLFTQ